MKPEGGFTLIELITAAAIFSMLGVMLFTMVRAGMTMWNEGELSRNEMERGVMALELMSKELRLTFTENDPLDGRGSTRFISDFLDYDRDGDGVKETRIQRLRFVRINVEERENEQLQRAGDQILGLHYFSLFEVDPALLKEEGARPTEGLAEAAFMAFAPPVGKKDEPEVLPSLYRGYRTPIGGEDSYFAPGNLVKPEQITSSLLPVLDGILHLEFRFWNQQTRTFDASIASPKDPEGAGYTWDSTRGILPVDEEAAPNSFRFAAGEASLEDGTDDIFPSRVLITLVVEDPQSRGMVPMVTDAVKVGDMRIPVDVAMAFEKVDEDERFVRINSEWIRYSGVEKGALVVAKRGLRNTIPAVHPPGSQVHLGKIFSMEVEIPTTKACWNDLVE